MYTKPKIFIPTKIVDGKKVPTIEKGKYWYVYYYYRNPVTGVLEKYIEKQGINRIKTITERKRAIKNLQKAVLLYLQKGYNPFEDLKESLVDKENFTMQEAFKIAIEEKSKVWSIATKKGNIIIFNLFTNWLQKNNLLNEDIKKLTKRHVILFLNSLKVNPTTRNSYRRIISSVIGQLVADEIIQTNFVNSIPKLKETPVKNKAFTKQEITNIKNYLLKEDPYLYTFIKFVMYGFMRPVEVTRIQIKDINLTRNIIQIKSKTETTATIYITSQLKETIAAMQLENYNKTDFLFTKFFKPGKWETETEKAKPNFFTNRFKKVKEQLGFGKEYGIYSFRHSSAVDLFTSYIKQGLTDLEARHKMMPITRHKSIDSLNKYLRGIGASLPKDYSDDYTLDF
ncbi:tyrosine-type recombinase/integrase [Polaribacter aestuariivivens]|uniref:tyrosine-type recombinase/integrase n=1 Tax=Polaribacter aestuariivivens TaxID=2304626 RepID=UPI003F4966EF